MPSEQVSRGRVESTILYYKATTGKRNGFFMSVGGGMHGTVNTHSSNPLKSSL